MMIKIILLSVIVCPFITIRSNVYADRVEARNASPESKYRWTARGATEYYFESLYESLKKCKASCGRYPTTEENIKILYSKKIVDDSKPRKIVSNPIPKDCKDGSFQMSGYGQGFGQSSTNSVDGWNDLIEYESNGKSYEVKASHGYILTPKSRPHKYGYHWTNRRPSTADEPRDPPGDTS